MNQNGTISPTMNTDLVLGLHPNVKDGEQPGTDTATALLELFSSRPDFLQYTQVSITSTAYTDTTSITPTPGFDCTSGEIKCTLGRPKLAYDNWLFHELIDSLINQYINQRRKILSCDLWKMKLHTMVCNAHQDSVKKSGLKRILLDKSCLHRKLFHKKKNMKQIALQASYFLCCIAPTPYISIYIYAHTCYFECIWLHVHIHV